MTKTLLFISPHSKNIGETYVLPRLLRESLKDKMVSMKLFNSVGEWDHIDKNSVIDNPLRKFIVLCPNIESISPWWNYRIWLSFTSILIIFGLPLALFKEIFLRKKNYVIISRMATSSVALSKMITPFSWRATYIASMAGVPLMNAYRKYLLRFVYLAYDKVVSPVEMMIPYLKEILNENTIYEVIENPVIDNFDIDKFKEMHQKRDFSKRTPNQTVNILSVGRHTRQKGFDTLIKAIAESKYNFELTIYGDGEDTDSLQELINSKNISAKINLAGYSNEPFKRALEYDLFIMPSRWEGPGHTIIEALNNCMPSIVSDCFFGPQETVDNGQIGYVFRSDDKDDLKATIEFACENYHQFANMLKKAELKMDIYTPKKVWNKWKKFT